jgi:hypothetical protein
MRARGHAINRRVIRMSGEGGYTKLDLVLVTQNIREMTNGFRLKLPGKLALLPLPRFGILIPQSGIQVGKTIFLVHRVCRVAGIETPLDDLEWIFTWLHRQATRKCMTQVPVTRERSRCSIHQNLALPASKREAQMNARLVKLVFALMVTCLFFSRIEHLAWAQNGDAVPVVSLINLIATPERYDGKKVIVTGYVYFEFENRSLCLFERVASSRECLWINVNENIPASEAAARDQERSEITWKSYHHNVVTIQGVFDMSDKGHLGGWSGGIRNIDKVFVRKP